MSPTLTTRLYSFHLTFCGSMYTSITFGSAVQSPLGTEFIQLGTIFPAMGIGVRIIASPATADEAITTVASALFGDLLTWRNAVAELPAGSTPPSTA